MHFPFVSHMLWEERYICHAWDDFLFGQGKRSKEHTNFYKYNLHSGLEKTNWTQSDWAFTVSLSTKEHPLFHHVEGCVGGRTTCLSSIYCVESPTKKWRKKAPKKKKKILKEKKMHIIDNQKPSTLALRIDDDDDFRLSCRSSSSNERVEEHARGGRDNGRAGRLVGEIDGWALDGGDGEKLDLGAGIMIPLRLGDLDICFPAMVAGSCRGKRQEYFMSCMILRFSTMALMVGLSDGSFRRHLWAMSATVLAALAGKRPFKWGSMISDSRQSSARKGRLHLTKFLSSLGWRLSRFFRPVSISRRTTPKLQTLLLGVSNPFSTVSTERFATACTRMLINNLLAQTGHAKKEDL